MFRHAAGLSLTQRRGALASNWQRRCQPPPSALRAHLVGIGFLLSVSLTELAAMLSQQVGTRVVDATELSEGFDVKLEFRPENLGAPTTTLTDTPSLAVALREQLA